MDTRTPKIAAIPHVVLDWLYNNMRPSLCTMLLKPFPVENAASVEATNKEFNSRIKIFFKEENQIRR